MGLNTPCGGHSLSEGATWALGTSLQLHCSFAVLVTGGHRKRGKSLVGNKYSISVRTAHHIFDSHSDLFTVA